MTGYGFNTASWLTSIAIAPANATYNNYVGLSYNPAGQIVTRSPSNASYLYTPPASYADSYTSNGLNQYTAARGATPTYTDARGNMTYDGSKTYGYDYSNRLVSASGSPGATLSYDPLGRLYLVAASSTYRFVYDGTDVIAEYDASGNVLRRYVHGPGLDEPLVWFEGAGHSGSGTPDRRHLYADERGSVVAIEGASVAVNKYDSYGIPASTNTGRFQYTGQMWLPEVGLYHYKARAYSPQLGRFMQTDPIGYGDGMNMYAYVGNDPVNRIDPYGLVRHCLPVTAQSSNRTDDRIEIVAAREVCINILERTEVYGDYPFITITDGQGKSIADNRCTAIPADEPRLPDIYTGSITYAIPQTLGLLKGTLTTQIDRYGNIYGGGSIGVGNPSVSVSPTSTFEYFKPGDGSNVITSDNLDGFQAGYAEQFTVIGPNGTGAADTSNASGRSTGPALGSAGVTREYSFNWRLIVSTCNMS